MDNNPIAPFHLHLDEVILCMQQRKKEDSTIKSCVFVSLLISFMGFGGIALFCFLYLIRYNNFIVSMAIPFIFLWLPLIIGFVVAYNIDNVKLLYYVTNYRLIEFRDDKSLNLRFGYISDLNSIKICNYDNNVTSLEFEWNDSEPNFNYCYGFNNIDNVKEIYDIIIKLQEELKNKEYTFDFIAQ